MFHVPKGRTGLNLELGPHVKIFLCEIETETLFWVLQWELECYKQQTKLFIFIILAL